MIFDHHDDDDDLKEFKFSFDFSHKLSCQIYSWIEFLSLNFLQLLLISWWWWWWWRRSNDDDNDSFQLSSSIVDDDHCKCEWRRLLSIVFLCVCNPCFWLFCFTFLFHSTDELYTVIDRIVFLLKFEGRVFFINKFLNSLTLQRRDFFLLPASDSNLWCWNLDCLLSLD